MPQSDQEPLHFVLLGAPSWCKPTMPSPQPLERKYAPLIALAAVAGGCPRSRLKRLLWPGAAADRATESLSTGIYRLRLATGRSCFEKGADPLRLLGGITADVLEDPTAWSDQRLLAQGDFLDGVHEPSLGELSRWIDTQRRHWRAVIAAALCQRAETADHGGRLSLAQQLAERAVVLNPALEAGWLLRMRVHMRKGERSAALQCFSDLEHELRRHGRPPAGEAARALLQRVVASAPATPAPVGAAPLAVAQLVGREGALAAMARAWAAGRPYLLRGEDGMGKTRLLQAHLAPLDNVVHVACRPDTAQAPYALLSELLRALIATRGIEPTAALRGSLGVILPEWAGSAPPGEDPALTLWLGAERLLHQAASNQAPVLAIDDLQFADVASLRALRWLAAQPQPRVYWALATRIPLEGAGDALVQAWLADPQGPQPVDLMPWGLGQLSELIAGFGLGAVVSPEHLHAHAGGNPRLSVATLEELAHAGTGASGLPLPASTLPALMRRLRALGDEALNLLGLAGVMDTAFKLDRDHGALGLDAEQARALLDRLEAAGVMRGERFANELMRRATLELLVPSARRRWHAVAAGILAADPRVPRARVAAQWHAAQRWPDAGAAFHQAGLAARDVGRHPEADDLLNKAADAFLMAHDEGSAFDALADSVDGLMTQRGPTEVEQRLSRMQAWTTTQERRARLAILRAELRINHYHEDPQAALAAAQHAHGLAWLHPALRVDALTVLGPALAQCRRFDEAVEIMDQATLEAAARPRQLCRVLGNFGYVHFEAGRVEDGLRVTADAARLAQRQGDATAAGQLQGNLAALLMQRNPALAVAPARAARALNREVETGQDGLGAGMGLVALGSALAYDGRFREALEVLEDAVRQWSGDARSGPLAKAQLALAHVLLLLGCDERALAALPTDAKGWLVPLQVQWHWAQARAAAMAGRPGAAHLRRMAEIHAEQGDAPLPQVSWIEWSRQGHAAEVVWQMQRLRPLYTAGGMLASARTVSLRQLDRMAEIDALGDAAARLASQVRAEVGDGLHAQTYLPEAWLILATAYERQGERTAADDCRRRGREWIETVALPHVPQTLREPFLARNPVNRALVSRS